MAHALQAGEDAQGHHGAGCGHAPVFLAGVPPACHGEFDAELVRLQFIRLGERRGGVHTEFFIVEHGVTEFMREGEQQGGAGEKLRVLVRDGLQLRWCGLEFFLVPDAAGLPGGVEGGEALRGAGGREGGRQRGVMTDLDMGVGEENAADGAHEIHQAGVEHDKAAVVIKTARVSVRRGAADFRALEGGAAELQQEARAGLAGVHGEDLLRHVLRVGTWIVAQEVLDFTLGGGCGGLHGLLPLGGEDRGRRGVGARLLRLRK
jgi:hypothetical protein